MIALARIERLDLLRQMFGKLLLPDAVWIEVAEEGLERPGAELVLHARWIEHKSVADRALVSLLRHDLGAGESEAIALAREVADPILLLDERLGRAAAKRLGLRVTGLVGVLIAARERGLLADPQKVADDLQQVAGFWMTPELRLLVIGH